jgi:type I restriction enzyme S subunit
MRYKLKDLCSITKGATGIMKADGGKYPLVALSDERRSHSEYQFDAKAVIVPLISSTGHGHASMKRVHYQEGKFALGNILSAIIPNDEKQLHPKYLHLYLQQFKDSLLVPLMKGAANVSLPMNKLSDVEIEVPSLERQLEIIELEEEAAELKNEMEERLIAQDGDVAKLRQAIYREAIQGKLSHQDKNDNSVLKLNGQFSDLKEYEVSIKVPDNWVLCRFKDVAYLKHGHQFLTKDFVPSGFPVIKIGNCNSNGRLDIQKCDYISKTREKEFEDFKIVEGDLLMALTGGTLGKVTLVDKDYGTVFQNYRVGKFTPNEKLVSRGWLKVVLSSDLISALVKRVALTTAQPNLGKDQIEQMQFPLPPLEEQNRIVIKLEQLMQLCDELQYSIQQSKIENEKLLQGALRDALKKEEVEV